MTVSTEEKRHHRNSRLESIKGKRNSHVEEGYTCTCQSLYNSCHTYNLFNSMLLYANIIG